MSRRDRGPRVFVGRIPNRTEERDLEKFFRGFGRLRDVNLKNGFAFVEFDDERDAEDAVYELNHKELMGERVTVEHAHPSRGGGGYGGGYRDRDRGGPRGGFRFRSSFGAPYNTDWRIIVENVSTRCGWQDLKDFMRQAGEVSFTQCHKDRVGEGVVDFANESDMRRAIKKLDGEEFMGKKIRLVETRSSKSARRSRSPSPRRSRSRSRSPKRQSASPARRSPSPRPAKD